VHESEDVQSSTTASTTFLTPVPSSSVERSDKMMSKLPRSAALSTQRRQ